MAEPDQELEEVARQYREHPGLRAKGSLAMVREILGPTDWVRGPGDDAALIGDDLLAAGEAIWPPLVEAEPFVAGAAAVVTNVNDVAAMGGRPLALLDTIAAPEAVARRVLEGLRYAARLYDVPVVGGHLTVREGPAAVSAFVVGRVRRPLSARAASPGQSLLVGCCLEGDLRGDPPIFTSLRARGDRVRGDLELLAQAAEEGLCVAAKDVSMAGLLGSLAMLLEPTGTGVAVDLDRLPRPDGVSLAAWTAAFPSFAFLLCAPPDLAGACAGLFEGRGLVCRQVGRLDDSGLLRARLRGHEMVLAHPRREGVTRLGGGRA